MPAEPRFNQLGVQQVSNVIFSQLFPGLEPTPPQSLVELSQAHLKRHHLLGKTQEKAPPIAFRLPPLQGYTLDEHFSKLGKECAEPWLTFAQESCRSVLPRAPRRWAQRSGWTRYNEDGTWEPVDAPCESTLTFDTEVMWRESTFAVMACAASDKAWYSWLSPWLMGESNSDRHLIPLGDATAPRVIIGHNIGYDRARVLEEYSVKQSKNFFLDTMSLHVAVNGMCSQQRPTWMKHKKNRDIREKAASESHLVELTSLLEQRLAGEEEEELWVGRSSINSLRDVAKFHCNVTIDKTRRDDFGELQREGVRERLDELLDYCAADVAITHRVFQKVFPSFLRICPHPVSFGALRHLSSVILPIDRSWRDYLHNANSTYQRLSDKVEQRLQDLAFHALECKDLPAKYQSDNWLGQLDWSGQEVRMVKGKKGQPSRPAARQKKPGMPQWFKDLFQNNSSGMALTVRTRIAPLLLRLSWDGAPLVWSNKYGWTFKVPVAAASKYESKPVIKCDLFDDNDATLRDDKHHQYFKLPHKDGPQARCTNPLAKGYLQFFESGTLSSEYPDAREALDMNASCSYWISARDRICSQMDVYQEDVNGHPTEVSARSRNPESEGFILPQIIPMGTITRRAVENTWLTASNAKSNRVGSELKSMIKAPAGYCFVGADVDSQELWIASLVGDAQFQLHGGSAIGFMTLEGNKAAGTDLHSKTAKILGISRNDAKVFNYGRIYGAGVRFASTLLRQFNPNLSEAKSQAIAARLYQETKGTKSLRRALKERSFWRGGTESLVFNRLEDFAELEHPRTPALGAGITEALMRRYISRGAFMTSRINWAIQSSGVDYLHLLITSMDYLVRRFNINARLAISVHDEIRYLVALGDRYRAAMALQIANVWTRALFSERLGIRDLPQSCAYFSAVDVDHVLRKEVDMDCVTPSHPSPIPPGESLTIDQLLEKGALAALTPDTIRREPLQEDRYQCVPQTKPGEGPEKPGSSLYLRAQISSDPQELNEILKEAREGDTKLTTSTSKQHIPSSSRGKHKERSHNHPQEPKVLGMPASYQGYRQVPRRDRAYVLQ